MSFRVVNGNTHTEDGWRCCNRDECDLVRIPDLFLTETAPLRKGPPLVILGAWLFWYDRNVEEILTSVWGWSVDNAVLGQPGRNNGSNHLSATAIDVNAPKYPWGTFRMPPDKIAKVEEGLKLFEGSVFWGRGWSKPDEMHYQMAWREDDGRNGAFAQKLLGGHLGIYRPGPPPAPAPAPASYGLPTGSRVNYGAPGFPDWVYQLANAFGVKASTYPGHQESDRNEGGFAPNPRRLNRGIDWAGPVDKMQALADYLLNIRGSLEQVIWQNPNTGQRTGVAGGKDVSQTGYYASNYGGHRDHVHSRQSAPIPVPGAPPTPPPPSPVEDGALVLSKAMGGSVSLERYRELLPTFRAAVAQARADTPARINMFVAQVGHESGGLKYMEEIADGSAYEGRTGLGNTQPGDGKRFKGRGPIQVTGRHNYTELSEWAHSRGYIPTPTFFVDEPAQLASPRYGFLGAVWYWTVAQPGINAYCDVDDIERVSKLINMPANVNKPGIHAHGIQDRINRWHRARSMDLAPIMRETGPPPPPSPIEEDDFLSALTPEEQREVLEAARLQNADRKSRSPLRELDEGVVGDTPDQIWDMDGSIHILVVYLLASLGHPGQLALLNRIASADPVRYPDRQSDRMVAQAILADVAENEEIKQSILNTPERTPASVPESLGPREMPPWNIPMPPAVIEPEVLPAIPDPVPGELVDEADKLIGGLEMFVRFNKKYRKLFGELTEGPEEK